MGGKDSAEAVAINEQPGFILKSQCYKCRRRWRLHTGNPATEIKDEEWYTLKGEKVKIFRCGACGALMLVWANGRSASAPLYLAKLMRDDPEAIKLRVELDICERLRNNVIVFPNNKNHYADQSALAKYRAEGHVT